eukprot:TRINITY_DN21397_c0_g2_i1.p1 TRINITY_DN21397_c0_g2~~TRINITY_DN21397_c0_g2_i1.p1  ORF type:complete len:672 (-),score=58.23 TRINITY_DN21397_c0_g2_i1:100-2115(-)
MEKNPSCAEMRQLSRGSSKDAPMGPMPSFLPALSGQSPASRRVRLTSSLPSDLIRGVPGHIALQGYGRHWKGIAGGPGDFLLSKGTGRIDDFVSHDWRTPRMVKYVTLCYTYNRNPALLGSTFFAGLCVFAKLAMGAAGYIDPMSEDGVQLESFVCFVVLGPVAFGALLFHWHWIQGLLGYATILFVDKLCICQHDEDMKSQGILGLAAFLKHSQRILVLWSPTYFSRLWCTYELAAWFRCEKQVSSVCFVPVEVAPRLLAGLLIVAAACIAFYIEGYLLWSEWQPVALMIGFACWVFGSYVLHGHTQHVAGLRQELEDFEIQRASCFCCSNNHLHPETGMRLMCDRKMVYNTLQDWIGSTGTGEGEDDFLTIFNAEVRTTLKSYVTETLPERHLFFRYSDFIFMSFPWLWLALDGIIFVYGRGYANMWLDFGSSLAAWLLSFPLAVKVLMSVMRVVHRHAGSKISTRLTKIVIASCVWGPLGFTIFMFLWTAVRAYLYSVLGLIWLWFPAIVIQLLLTFYVFAGSSQTGYASLFSWGLGRDKRFSLNSDPRTSREYATPTSHQMDGASVNKLAPLDCEARTSRDNAAPTSFKMDEASVNNSFDCNVLGQTLASPDDKHEGDSELSAQLSLRETACDKYSQKDQDENAAALPRVPPMPSMSPGNQWLRDEI